MGRDRLEKLLARLHQGPADVSSHKLALRAELVARFRTQFPQSARTQRAPPPRLQRAIFRRLAIAFVLLIGLGAASRAPADFPIEVGQRIELSMRNPAPDWPRAPELEPVLQQLGHTDQIELRGRRGGDGLVTLTIEIWGEGLANDAAAQLRSAFPALKDAQIKVTALEGNVHGNLGEELGLKWFHRKADPAALEAARRELQQRLLDELKAQGKDGSVDVKVGETPDGKRKVTVKVQAVGEAPGETEELKPAPAP